MIQTIRAATLPATMPLRSASLSAQVSNAGPNVVCIVFGALMFCECAGALATGWRSLALVVLAAMVSRLPPESGAHGMARTVRAPASTLFLSPRDLERRKRLVSARSVVKNPAAGAE